MSRGSENRPCMLLKNRPPYCIMLALYNAFKGKLQNGYAFCGANAWRAEKIQSVRDLMAALRDEYDNFSLKEKLFGAR